MQLNRYLKPCVLPLALMTVMLLTRFQHFGNALHLPDASLAVFYFAGFYRKAILLGILMALAAGIDYVAVGYGASAACLSPAYVFLLPAYTALWLAGRYSANLLALKNAQAASWIFALSLLALSASIAFVISNAGFYLFSGIYPDTSWMQYLARVAGYYPPYLSSTLIYGITGLGLIKLVKAMAWLKPEPKPTQ